MRLFLSSFRLGRHSEAFAALFGKNRRVALIANADDYKLLEARAEGVARELGELSAIGLEPFELDLRAHFDGDPAELERILATCGGVWVRGGNVFVLRRALRRSGADALLVPLVREDRIVYGGYSAGACVLTPSLRGLEVADDPAILPPGYETMPEPVWEGFALVPYVLAPHVPREGEAEPWITAIVREFEAAGTTYRTLADGEAIAVDGEDERFLS